MDDAYLIEFKECPCGQGHNYLLAVPLSLPEEEGGYVYTHIVVCPNTGEEMLLCLDEVTS